MKLNPGITVINFISYILLQFVTYVSFAFVLSFVTVILKDPAYYDVPKDQLASELGIIATWAEVITMIFYLFLGVIFDTLGRKIPVLLGFLLTALAIGAIPLFKSIFPSYLILKICISLGTVIGMNVPFLPDYV